MLIDEFLDDCISDELMSMLDEELVSFAHNRMSM